MSYLCSHSRLLIGLTLLISSHANGSIVTNSFTVKQGDADAYAETRAGARAAHANALSFCNTSDGANGFPTVDPNCGAAASAFVVYDYTVQINPDDDFFLAAGISSLDPILIPIDLSYELSADGRAHATLRAGGYTQSVYGPGLRESAGVWQLLVSPGGSINVQLEASANANAGANTQWYVEAEAYADPVVSINQDWEFAAFAGLIDIEEFLAPVEIESFGSKPNGHEPSLIPDGSELLTGSSLSAVPVPAAVWLFGTALVGLFGFNKRRKAA